DRDRVNRPAVRIARFGAGLVDLGLVDDRVDHDRGLAGPTVADDELSQTAADRNHRVDGHDAGLQRLADRFPRDNPWSEFLDRIESVRLDRALAVDGAADRVDDAAEKRFANGNLEQAACRLSFVPLF